MNLTLPLCCALTAGSAGLAADFGIQSFSATGVLTLTNAFTNGVATVERSDMPDGPWSPWKNIFTTAPGAGARVDVDGPFGFYRVLAVDLSNGREGFTNLVTSFDLLTTVAGAGGSPAAINKWLPEFEGGPATNALLSRPHIAVADAAGNIFIADKDSHGVRKVLRDGTIITVAGTNGLGNGPDELTPGTEVALNEPNGLWVRPDGTCYILDLMNGKVRRLDTNGMLSTLFRVPGGILAGRGLWVNDDGSLAFVASGTVVKKWTPKEGVTDYASGFVELGNLAMDPTGHLVVTDRRGHSVWRLFDGGTKIRIAGNGTPSTVDEGGGDGGLATATPLNEVRGIWFLPTGACFLCTHRGSQVWYLDVDGYIHLFLNGATSDPHSGDGTWFWNPTEYRISENRAVTMDFEGNLLITENDAGYVRKVQFLRHVQ